MRTQVEHDAFASKTPSVVTNQRPFGKRALPGVTPRGIISVFWDLNGKRSAAVYRKAKIYKYPVNNVQQFLRKLTLDERTGEILEDEVSNLEIVPTELSAIITNGEGRLLFSKASSKVHPMMPGGVGSTIKDLVRLLQTSIGGLHADDFVYPVDPAQLAVAHVPLRNGRVHDI